MSIVLMYHALYEDEVDLDRIDPLDRPYAVSMENFKIQMEMISSRDHGVLEFDQEKLPEIVLTFDDGHISNYDRAFPILKSLGLRAYFFVTTDFILNRDTFCDWSHLSEMQAEGMIIGGHGQSHRFFADMSVEDSQTELTQSKKLIEAGIGSQINSMSFPGGRCSANNLDQARSAGYGQIFGSKFGKVRHRNMFDGAAISRIPVRINTTTEQFKKMIDADTRLFAVERTKGALKHILKKTLGNNLYHGLYKSVSDGR